MTLLFRRAKTVVTFLLFLGVFGLFAYFQLPKAQDPGYTVRTAKVTTFFPGASAERVESLVTDKLEKVIGQIPQIDYLKSRSRTGLSSITVQINETNRDMRPIWDTLRKKVEKATHDLPHSVVGPYVNDEFGDVFGTVVTVSGDGFSYYDLKEVAEHFRDELLLQEEVAKVEIYGEQKQTIFIDVQDSKISKIGGSSLRLKQMLEGQNIILSGGELITDREKIYLEPTGNFESFEDLKEATLYLPQASEVVYLKDIAHITRGFHEPFSSKVSSSGKPALALAISLSEGGKITDLGSSVRRTIEKMQQAYPLGVEFDEILFESDSVERKIHAFSLNLLQSIALVIGVLLIVFGIKTGVIVATLIPLTILITFACMQFLGIGIDQVSLASLILSLGIMVDNAIVISESIVHRVRGGASVQKGATEAVAEFGFPLVISTLTTAAAFLPIFLAKSGVGEYTSSIFKVVTLALLISWALALSWIPILAVTFLKKRKKTQVSHHSRRVALFYEHALLFILRYKKSALIGFCTLFVLAMGLFSMVPKAFFPPNEEPVLTVELTLPSGTNIFRTEEVVKGFEELLREDDQIMNWVAFVGGMAPRYTLNYTPEPVREEKAYLYLNVSSYQVTESLKTKLETFSKKQYPELTLNIKKLFYGTPVEAPIGVRLSSRNHTFLEEFAMKTQNQLSKINGVKNVRNDWGEKTKKIVVDVDKALAAKAGLTNRDVALSLQTSVSGFVTTTFREGDELIPVVLRSVEAERESIDRLKLMTVYSQNTNASVPLMQIADIKTKWEKSKIVRRDRQRTIEILADKEPSVSLKAINGQLVGWLEKEKQNWPSGTEYVLSGLKEKASKAQRSINVQIPFAALLIILLLMIKFNSFRLVTLILSTIPLSLIGVVFGLLIMQIHFGFMGFLGVVALAGIIVNNGIVLIEQINISRAKEGQTHAGAILEAARLRCIPILLSTLTAILGLLPLVIAGGGMFRELASVIVFGLLFGGILTLGFLPLLYSIFYKLSFSGEKL